MENEMKLTKLAECAGCAAKVGAETLKGLLDGLKVGQDERLLVGFDKSDDACVYLINEDTALVNTVDFFPPVADDPYLYGQIAAANALSDVYAMGAKPCLALNILGIPKDMPKEAVHEILRGGYDKVYEAGAIIAGGHSIHTKELLYGLSVSGFADPKRLLKNDGAKAGDKLILTKPLGTGILTTAIKADLADDELKRRVYNQLTALNKYAGDIMTGYLVNACTDVTGFSLLGHCCEMAAGSKNDIALFISAIPYHKEAYDFAKMGLIPEGAYKNREYTAGKITAAAKEDRALMDILYDPQTNGGLLISLPENEAIKCLDKMRANKIEAAIIGEVREPLDAKNPHILLE